MIVVDASVIPEMLRMTPAGLEFGAVLENQALHAPHLIDPEVTSALRRWEFRREVPTSEVELALEVFRRMPITR